MEIKNCVAIVTGGASGLGLATVRLFIKAGAKVAILDTDSVALNKIRDEVKDMAFICDVSDEAAVKNCLQKIQTTLGTIRICVNCAGIVQGKRIVGKQGALPLEEFEKVIRINLIGTFNLMRLTAERMINSEPIGDSAERGVIINTASIAAFEGQIGQAAYSASKGGVVALTLPAARELAQFGIRVMTIAPGLVDTPMFDKIPPEARKALAESVPFPKRLGNPYEYAELALHIIKNAMLNGSVIRLDGGLRMQEK